MATWADKPQALDGQYPADLSVRLVGDTTWTNLGAVRGAVATWNGTDIIDILSDNRWTLKKFTNLSATIGATLLETQDPDKFNLLFNSTRTLVASAPVAEPGEVIGDDLTSGTIYTLVNKNGANTEVASITVSDTGGALVLDTDYKVKVDSQGYTYLVFLNATTGETTVDYTYTPNESVQQDVTTGSNELKNFEVKLEVSLESKVRTITIGSATLNSEYSTNFADIAEAGDVTGSEVTFDSNKGTKITYFDEILD